MSARNRSKTGKKNHGKVVKLPEGVLPLKKCLDAPVIKGIQQITIDTVDELMGTEWESYMSRPRGDTFGLYAICRWYSQDQSWVILYVGQGHIGACLDQHFSGRQRTPIGNYLSSFPKASRNLLWIKWLKDTGYHRSPQDVMNLDEAIEVLQHRYNDGEKPPFNMDFDPKEEMLPSDFSIVPDWNKTKKSKKATEIS